MPHSRLALHNVTMIDMKTEPATKGCVDIIVGGQWHELVQVGNRRSTR